MTVGERIRAARTAQGLTQDELGGKCGIAGANIRKYELGKANPKFSTLARIADALSIPVQDLIEDWGKVDTEDFIKRVCYGEGITVPDAEERISAALEKLSTTGQNVAVERVEELTKIPDYQK